MNIKTIRKFLPYRKLLITIFVLAVQICYAYASVSSDFFNHTNIIVQNVTEENLDCKTYDELLALDSRIKLDLILNDLDTRLVRLKHSEDNQEKKPVQTNHCKNHEHTRKISKRASSNLNSKIHQILSAKLDDLDLDSDTLHILINEYPEEVILFVQQDPSFFGCIQEENVY